MLKSINRRYLLFGIIILLVFIPFWNGEFSAIYILNFVALYSYYTIINLPINKSKNYFTKKRLSWLVCFYTAFFVIINKVISFYYTDNLFVFSEADAVQYHEGASAMITRSFLEGIDYILEKYEYEDLGMFIVVSSLYRIIESNLFLSFFYITVSIITSISIFRISKNFISAKYSFICSLTYSLSSFVIWFHSSGLKESFMVMLIVLFYDHYYMFIRFRAIKYLLFSTLFLLSILLFRPVLVLFCIASIIIAILVTRKGKFSTLLLIVVGVVLIFFSYSFINSAANKFLLGGTELMLANKEADGMVIGSVQFTYQVNILAAAIGPLPTILPDKKQTLSISSVGLIYRVFTSIAFWLGVYYVIRQKENLMYPILLFIFMEAISLVFILEGLELRKSLPHFPFIYILSFWFLDNYDKKEIGTQRGRHRLKNIWNISSVLFLVIILYWNFR